MPTPIPEEAQSLVVMDAQADKEKIANAVDFIFLCGGHEEKEEIRALEEAHAKLGARWCSNNSAHRWTPDVPMVIPEVNPEHLAVLEAQKARLGTKRGFIAGEVQLLHPIPMPRPCIPCGPMGWSGCWCAPIRRFQAQARPLRLGRKSWTTWCPTLAAREGKVGARAPQSVG